MSKVTISIDENKLEADFNNSNTAKALLEKFPLKLAMINLYSREMTYHFSKFIPAKKVKTSGYEVGDVGYWKSRHSFVIFYNQTGEVIGDLQIVGHINSDTSLLNAVGDTEVTFD